MVISKYRDDRDSRGVYWDGTPEEEQQFIQAQIPIKTEELWQAAHAHEYAGLNGSAVGMVTLGILQGKPKCTAVQAWCQSIWALYYSKKTALLLNLPYDTDFSVCGNIPHTIPELMVELGLA